MTKKSDIMGCLIIYIYYVCMCIYSQRFLKINKKLIFIYGQEITYGWFFIFFLPMFFICILSFYSPSNILQQIDYYLETLWPFIFARQKRLGFGFSFLATFIFAYFFHIYQHLCLFCHQNERLHSIFLPNYY